MDLHKRGCLQGSLSHMPQIECGEVRDRVEELILKRGKITLSEAGEEVESGSRCLCF